MKLVRFWIEFAEPPRRFASVHPGFGVTAYDIEDALSLVREKALEGQPLPQIARCVENVDISTLDEGHVIPNMHAPVRRGIWFPMGFQ
jgi:hypothetical protein